jgi:hypothetical protein
MKEGRHLFKGVVLAMGLGGLLLVSSSWAGQEFEPPIPKFPYGPTDPKGNPYSVAATDLVYSPKTPYVRASSEVAKFQKSKRTTRRAAKSKAAPTDFKGTP